MAIGLDVSVEAPVNHLVDFVSEALQSCTVVNFVLWESRELVLNAIKDVVNTSASLLSILVCAPSISEHGIL